MDSPNLTSKQSPTDIPATMLPSTKKSKAEFKRQSAARAKAWAEQRKLKNERNDDSEIVEENKETKLSGGKRDDDSVEEEQRDEPENLPPTPLTTRATRRSARRPLDSSGYDNSNGMNESSESSRVLRRRTMDVAATPTAEDASKNVISTPVAKKGGRATKSLGPGVAATPTKVDEKVQKSRLSGEKIEEERATRMKQRRSKTPQKKKTLKKSPTKPESAIADENRDECIEEKGNNRVVVEEEVKESRNEEVGSENNEHLASEGPYAVGDRENAGEKIISNFQAVLPQFLVFTHALLLQWTIAFAIIVMFFPDWFIFQFCIDGACLGIPNNGTGFTNKNDRAACVTFGICLVIIAGNSIAYGPFNKVGWVLTTSSLAMVSFSTSIDWWRISNRIVSTVPSIPVYSKLNVPDLLVLIGLIGTIAALNQVRSDSLHIESKVEKCLPNVQPEAVGLDCKDGKEQEGELENGEKVARKCIGLRIAVEKDGVIVHGAVTDYDHLNRVWCVEYDNTEQDTEFLNRIQLASAIKEHAKEWTGYLKAIWLDGSI